MNKTPKKSQMVIALLILGLTTALSYFDKLSWHAVLIFVMVGVGYKLHDPVD